MNATADDLPGPGRLLDKYVYQAWGRKLEHALGVIGHGLGLGPAAAFECILRILEASITSSRPRTRKKGGLRRSERKRLRRLLKNAIAY